MSARAAKRSDRRRLDGPWFRDDPATPRPPSPPRRERRRAAGSAHRADRGRPARHAAIPAPTARQTDPSVDLSGGRRAECAPGRDSRDRIGWAIVTTVIVTTIKVTALLVTAIIVDCPPRRPPRRHRHDDLGRPGEGAPLSGLVGSPARLPPVIVVPGHRRRRPRRRARAAGRPVASTCGGRPVSSGADRSPSLPPTRNPAADDRPAGGVARSRRAGCWREGPVG